MGKRMRAALAALWVALFFCASVGAEAAEVYTFHFSGEIEGIATVQWDRDGKVTITSSVSGYGSYFIEPAICPFIPEWAGSVRVYKDSREIIIEGNTVTETRSDGEWSKKVMDGNTTTTTYAGDWGWKEVVNGNTTTTTYTDGGWSKTVVEGNTTTTTTSEHGWSKTVVEGNTTTFTTSYGEWEKTVVEGNITTFTDSEGWGWKEVVEGNTTTITYSDGDLYKTVVDKQGYDIFIFTQWEYGDWWEDAD
ncbi:MAG: hypothetical protein LBO67_01900 [Spirochaetaceae bacterium]|jgi:hypothetical protein|nr:hypothetical protein [Spirochaetaceae bacterium]